MLQSPVEGTTFPRVRVLDCARGVALLLMLLSHSLQLFPGGEHHDDWLLVSAILLLTKAATPLFVFVFGMTMVLVHYNRVLTPDGFGEVKQRMWRRALYAFLSFEFLVIVVETAEKSPLDAIVGRMLYVRPGNWIEVLNFYTVVLLIGPWVLRWWRRATIGIRVLVIPLLYVLGALLAEVQVPSYLFELKNIIAGYSHMNTRVMMDAFPVLQLSSFFLVGVSLGEYLFQERHTNQLRRVFRLLGLFIAAGLLTSFVLSGDTLREYLRNIAVDRYRFPPRIPYVLFGLSYAFGVTLICLWLVQVRNSTGFIVRKVELLGRHSLLTFNLQYVLLFTVYGLVLDELHQQSFPVSVLTACIVVVACVAGIWAWERWKRVYAQRAADVLP